MKVASFRRSLPDRGAQVLEVGGVDREEAAEDHRLHRPEAGQRGSAGRRSSVMVSPTRVSATSLIEPVRKPISPGPKLRPVEELRREDADLVDLVGGAGPHHADLHALLEHAVDDADQHHDAEIGVVPGVDEERLQRRVASPLGAGRRVTIASSTSWMPWPVLAEITTASEASRPITSSICCLTLRRLGGRQVDLVEDRHDLVVVVERLVDVGQRLGLDALAGVDHQERALAGGERAADLVGEVDVAGRVDEVEDVVLAVVGAVVQAARSAP